MSDKTAYTLPFKDRIQEKFHPSFFPLIMKATDHTERIFNRVEARLRGQTITNLQYLMLATRSPGVVLGHADDILPLLAYRLSLQAFQDVISVHYEAEPTCISDIKEDYLNIGISLDHGSSSSSLVSSAKIAHSPIL